MFLSNKVGGGGGGHRLAIEVVFRLRKRWWSDEYNSVDDVMCPRWQEGSAAVAGFEFLNVERFVLSLMVSWSMVERGLQLSMLQVVSFVEVVSIQALEECFHEYQHNQKKEVERVTGQHCQAAPLSSASGPSGDAGGPVSPITIGEALEATALTAGKKPVDWSDAAAIQAAEVRATGRTSIIPGGVGAAAESAANLNAKATTEEEKTKLRDILSNATVKLPSDKAATKGDAEGVKVAETSNDPTLTTHPAGVAANVATAARLNDKIAK
ncbi:late embryogenesis abundant protein D-34-like [Hibiscus syriacus]|uniref:late embryogenesis abundant protein D-34-like n=1 Tax=Hibiscus syriacus TaxID=106335 RepID=UPI00192305BF|nr:late embryogenesis abundant protein D-34-like [Hibiscus syriacus]